MKTLAWIFAVTAALVVSGSVMSGNVSWAQSEVYGTMMVVKGDIKVNSVKSGKVESAKVGFKVYAGDAIQSGPDSRAKIIMSDKNVINVSPDSKVTIAKYENNPAKNARNVELKVDYGKVRASVEQNYDGEKNKFNVRTPTAVAGVRGTDFVAGFNRQTRQTTVVTFHGVVAVGTPGANGQINNAVFVRPGQGTSVGEGQKAEPPKPVPQDQFNNMNQESSADTAKGGPADPGPGANSGASGGDKGENGEKKDPGQNAGPAGESSGDQQAGANGNADQGSGDKGNADKGGDKAANQAGSEPAPAANGSSQEGGSKSADTGNKPADGGPKNEPKSDTKSTNTAGASSNGGANSGTAPTSGSSGSSTSANSGTPGTTKGSSPSAPSPGTNARGVASIPSVSMIDSRDLDTNISRDIKVAPELPKVPTTYKPPTSAPIVTPTPNPFVDNAIRNQKSRVRVVICLPNQAC